MVEKIVDHIYDQLESWVTGKEKLTTSTLILLTTQIIMLVEEDYPVNGKGEKKKMIAMQVLEKVLKNAKMSEQDRHILLQVAPKIVSPAIDIMIGIAKHDIQLFKNRGFCC